MDTEGTLSVNPIRLNDASASELQHVRGLGVVLAERIVAYRDEHGLFASLADLASVPGIGGATLQRLAPQLTIEVPAALAEGSDPATAGGREYGAIAVPGAVAPGPALMKGSYAMGTDRPSDYQDAREEPTPEERAEERIPEVPPVEGLEPEEREPIPVEPSVTEGGVEETPEERPGVTEEPVVPPDRGEPAGAPSPWGQTAEPPAPPPTEERPPEEAPPERVAGAGPPPPPQRPRDTGERRDGGRSFLSWLLAALLGGLAGVLLTLLLLLLLTGTLDFASSREVEALSSNLGALASNQQQIAGRVDDLEQRAGEFEAAVGRIDDLEAQVAQAADDLGALQSDVSELRNQVSISLRSLDRRVNALDQSLSSLEETVESLQATVDDVRERVESIDAFFVALRDLLIDLEGPPEGIQGAATPTETPTADATVTPETTPSPEPTAAPEEEASPTPTPAG